MTWASRLGQREMQSRSLRIWAGFTFRSIQDPGRLGSLRWTRRRSSSGARILEPNDKYKHCVISCVLTIVCDVTQAQMAGWGKEIKDVFLPGDASIEDLIADYRGIYCGMKVKHGEARNCETQCRILYP